MNPDILSVALGAILSLILMLLAAACLYRSIRAQQSRIGRLEEALRTYNNANAAVGRHVSALEAEIRSRIERREPPVVTERAAPPQTALRQPPPPAGAAEQRLAALIRSRLGASIS